MLNLREQISLIDSTCNSKILCKFAGCYMRVHRKHIIYHLVIPFMIICHKKNPYFKLLTGQLLSFIFC
jgi:hypothetical protein